ncbi:MAG: PQQ-dependent dehydrogenase, methanol/ethanol family [Xanthobacteraceae bacterium]
MKLAISAAAVLLIANAASAQTLDDLKNDGKNTDNVLTYGMGYHQQRYSRLKEIDKTTVKRLVPVWNLSLDNQWGEQAQPIVYNGVMYVTNARATVAIDVGTGKQIWRTPVDWLPETTRVVCCGVSNKGAAIFNGKIYRTTLDAHVVALDAKTGKEVWKQKAAEWKDGYSMTVAPLVANGVVIAGVAGAEFGHRGYLEGFDPQTGKQLWRTYTIPAPGEPGSETWAGDSAQTGGGSTWITGSYDPELDLVFWGTGNPAPWNPLNRKGDNLYTNSVLAFQPKTGKVVWHFQMTPGDPFDYDGVNEWILADLPVDGGTRKVVMHADRNGYLYVIERATGKLVAANAFVKVNWADGIDKETGRPVWSAETKAVVDKGEKQRIYPAVSGGKNWGPMAFDPTRRLLYINTNEWGMDYEPAPVEQVANLKAGQPHYGVKFPAAFDADKRGLLRATDPLTGKAKWELPFKSPNIAGVLATAGGLVFTGMLTGELIAVDADTGKIVWQFQTPSGIVGQPITWEKDGKQYVTVTSGIGGVYALKMGDPNVAKVPAGGSLWTFKLFED